MNYQLGLNFAKQADNLDSLSAFAEKFHKPKNEDDSEIIYLAGNSLGLQPKTTIDRIHQELTDWANLGVEGHLNAQKPWMPYHEFLTEAMARVVGGKPNEVVVMNTLSVNLHLMMVSFYRPTKSRFKIMIESDAFPSDNYAVQSQLRYHGFDPSEGLIELKPREGEILLRDEDILDSIEKNGNELALVMLGNTNYYTGQYFDMKTITQAAHKVGSLVGFDCAHGAGNQLLDLHNTGCDWAVWCSYKYLNSGPGSLGGCFVHERHLGKSRIPRFEGWWGHNKNTRFGMRDAFDPIPSVEAWQLSNPPILSMAAIYASLKLFDQAGMENLYKKSKNLTGYLEYLIDNLDTDRINIITPRQNSRRGCQLSIQVKNADKSIFDRLHNSGVISDWREPDVIRVAPVPMYIGYEEVYNFVNRLGALL